MNMNYDNKNQNYDNQITPGAVSTPRSAEATYANQIKQKDLRLGVIPPPIAKDESSIDDFFLGI